MQFIIQILAIVFEMHKIYCHAKKKKEEYFQHK